MTKLQAIFANFKQEGFQKYFKNTSWLFAEKGMRIIASLVVGVWVARYLGPSQYGVFNYAISYVGIFIVLSTLGLDAIVIRELIKGKSHSSKLMGTTFGLKIGGAFIVLLLIFIAIQFSNHSALENKLILIIGSSAFLHSFNTIDYHFQSRVLSKYVVISQIAALTISSILKIYFILIEASLINFAWVVLYESIVLAIGLLLFYWRKGKGEVFKWKFNLDLAKELLTHSWPLIFSGLFVSLFLKIDQLMVKSILGESAVGNYAAASRLSETWFYIPMVICGSLFPAIINAKKKDEALYNKRLQRLFGFLFLLMLIAALVITFLGDFVINLLYGQEYIGAASVLIYQIWTGVFVAFGLAGNNWLISENLQKVFMIQMLCGALLNILLNYFLVRYYAIDGAAMATLISFLFTSYLVHFLHRSTRRLFWLQSKGFNLLRFTRIQTRE